MAPRSPHPDTGYTDTTVPRRGTVADFPPIFAGRGRGGPRLRRVLRPRRRLLAVGLALSAVGATATALPPPPVGARTAPAAHTAPPPRPGEQQVSAPVRIADAAAVALLEAGDRVDVIRTDGRSPRVGARCARVQQVPARAESAREGALIVLRLPRRAATALAGAAATSPLAVALC